MTPDITQLTNEVRSLREELHRMLGTRINKGLAPVVVWKSCAGGRETSPRRSRA